MSTNDKRSMETVKNQVDSDVRDAVRRGGRPADAFVLVITPDLARRMLATMTNYRPISRTTVERYRQILRNDEWRYTGQGVIIATNGCTLDAQHRLTAISEEGISAEMLVVLDVAPDVWRYLDQGKPRSGSDLIGCAHNVVASAVCILLQKEEATKSACGLKSTIVAQPSDAPVILDYYPEVKPAASWAVEHRKSIGAPVSQVAYAYLRARLHHAASADDFFERLASGVGIEEGSPILALRAFLDKNKVNTRKLNKSFVLGAFVKAWIAHLEGRSMSLIHLRKTELKKLTWPGARQERLPKRLRVDLRLVE